MGLKECTVILLINSYVGAVARSDNHFGLGSGPTILQSVSCTGSEQRLVECASANFAGSCSNHVGVECMEGNGNSRIIC